jgi:hypothetical protein
VHWNDGVHVQLREFVDNLIHFRISGNGAGNANLDHIGTGLAATENLKKYLIFFDRNYAADSLMALCVKNFQAFPFFKAKNVAEMMYLCGVINTNGGTADYLVGVESRHEFSLQLTVDSFQFETISF